MGQAAAWLIIPILALVLIGVLLSAAKVGIIVRWENDVFLLGSKLTLASIGDLQWHLFGIMLMLTLAGALVSDRHVRVDFLRQHMSARQKNVIDLVGHLVFLLPFCAIVIYHGYDFMIEDWPSWSDNRTLPFDPNTQFWKYFFFDLDSFLSSLLALTSTGT